MPSISQSVNASSLSTLFHCFPNSTMKQFRLATVYGAMALMMCGGLSSAWAQAKAATTTTLAVTSGGGAVTSVATYTMVTLTATVNAGSAAVTTGQVNFCDASATYCSDIHLLGSAQLTSAGTAAVKFRPGVGSHSYKAIFIGTGTNASSASAVATLTVTNGGGQHSAATLLSSTGSWGNYSLTGTVEEFGGTAPLTGDISFLDTSNGNAVLATAPLGASTPGLTWAIQAPCMNNLSPYSTVAADFNGDGYLDIAAVESPWNLVAIFVYQPTQGCYKQMASYTTGPSPSRAIAADFNSDGHLDLVIPNEGSNTLTLLLGNGDGTFTQSTVSVGAVPNSVVAADFNGDGIPDLAVGTWNNSVAILLGKGDGTFTAGTNLVIGSQAQPEPVLVTAGDFNGDGKIDLAVPVSAGVAVYQGNGDGTFGAASTVAVPVPANNWIWSLTAADLNGDGKLDLVISTGINVLPNGGKVMVLLGNGDGTFSLAASAATPEVPTQLTVADFNLDGIPDIAALDLGGTITVFVGKGDGTFLPTSYTATTTESTFFQAFAVGDMDGDGRPDILFPGELPPNSLVMYFGLTEPTQTASTAPTPIDPSAVGQHLVVASYPGDADATSGTSNPASLWGALPTTATTLAVTANGAPASTVPAGTAVTLTATVAAGSSPLTTGMVNFCDATANGCTDIHLLGSASLTGSGTASLKFIPGPGQHSYKAVLLENGYAATSSSPALPLTVTAPPKVPGPTTTTITETGSIGNFTLTATVTGNGPATALSGSVSFLDTSYSNTAVATAALGASSLGLAWNSLSSTPFTNVGFLKPAVDDFNGDGIPDLAVVNTNSMTVTILLGNGDGTFKTVAGLTLTTYPVAIIAGDFDMDGKFDLAVSSAGPSYNSPGTLTIFHGNGDGTFTAGYKATGLGSVFAAADFNSDGKLDLLVNQGSASSVILLGNGDGTFAQPLATGLSSALAVADLNADGILDLVTSSGNGMTMSVDLGNGDGTFRAAGSAMSASGNEGIGLVSVGDFNGDGIPDLAATGNYYSSPVIFLGNGDGTFSQVTGATNEGTNESFSMVVTDVNHDGKLDIVVTNGNSASYSGYVNSYNPDFAVLLGNGDGTFTSVGANTMLGSTGNAIVADFNGDGIPELAMQAGNNVVVLQPLLTETATATATGVAPTGPAPHQVDASYPGDSNYNSSVSATTPLDVQVAAPVFTPPTGTYASAQAVTITDATPGAKLYYSTTSSWPINWIAYTGPIQLSTEGSFFIQAYASETGYEPSSQVLSTYTLNLPPAPTPVITPGSGSHAGAQSVTISDSATGAPIYYTTDGTTPTTKSTLYSGPITVSISEIIAAIASGGGYNDSAPASAQIYIDSAASSFIYTIAGSESAGYAGDGGPATLAMLNQPRMTLLDNSGNIYIADGGNNVVRKVDAKAGTITTIAGTGMPGYSGDNGPATSAQLGWPTGLALDGSGNLYISDAASSVVRKITAATGVITTVAGSTTATTLGDNGPATSAQLSYPAGLAFDNAGNLYIASSERIRMVNANSGIITTFAGTGSFGSNGDGGPATSATLEMPYGMAFDNNGNLYFSDSNAGVVRMITAKTGVISTIAGKADTYGSRSPNGDGGPATSATLSYPNGIAVDGAGNVYIADYDNNEIREVTASDGVIHQVIGNPAAGCNALSGDGGTAGSSATCWPLGVTLDSAGDLLVAEAGSNRVRILTAPALPPTNTTAAPVFTVTAGTYVSPQTVSIASPTKGAAIYITLDGQDPTALSAMYHGPISVSGSVTIKALAVAQGYLPSSLVTAAYTITTPPTGVIHTVAGTGVSGSGTPGLPANSEQFGWLNGIAVDGAGNLYIPDQYNSVVWQVSATTGNATIVAGTLGGSYQEGGDGGPATSASLSGPTQVAVDHDGNLFIADTSAGTIRKVTAATGMISTYAGGSRNPGYLGDNGPATAAYLAYPQGLAVDTSGNLYIADQTNSRIRMVNPAGIISTVAGGGTAGLGDGGPATSAQLNFPQDVALDRAGNLYIADLYNGRVRKVIAQTGIISTIAGNGDLGESGDGALATNAELYPAAITVDPSGNVFIASWPNTVRMVSYATNLISTVASSGYAGFSGDGGAATVADFCETSGLAAGKSGSMYIADSCNYRVRELTYVAQGPTPVITWPTPAAINYGTALSATQLDATTTLTGTFLYTPAAGTVLPAGTQTLSVTFTPTDTTDYTTASASVTLVVNPVNPVPAIASLTPALTSAGSAAFSLTVNGNGLISGSTVYWGTTALATQYVNATQLTASVTAALVASAGTGTITVQTPAPGGGTSNSMQFEIDTAGAGSSVAPVFASTTASVAVGSTASYSVTLPSGATNVSVNCLNAPTGVTCSYAANTVSIATSSTTPKGTYQIIVVFSETLPGAATSLILLPFLLLPLFFLRRKMAGRGIWITSCLGLILLVGAMTVVACGGGGGGGSTPVAPANPTHQVTSSRAVTLTIQ